MTTVAQYLIKWDYKVLMRMAERTSEERVVRVVRRISQSADGHIYPVFLVLLASAQSDRWRVFGVFLFSFAIELTAYKVIKHLVKRQRPFHHLHGLVNLVVPQDFFSFPAGHTAGAFVVALSVVSCYPWLAIPACLWAALVGYSRIYLGVHYPTDTLAGACLGILSVKAGQLVGASLIISSIQ